MKILHCSDIHLGRRPIGPKCEYSDRRFEDYFIAFDHVVELALEKGVDVFLIAGDLFDKRDLTPDVLEKTEAILNKLKEKAIPVITIEGNHDKITSTDASWLLYLRNKGMLILPGFEEQPDKYVFIPELVKGVRFYGLGYSGALMDRYLDALASQLEPSEYNVVLAHTAVSSTLFFPGLVKSESVDRLKDKVKYFAGGHIHYKSSYPASDPFFYTPGSTEYWELGERGKKGVIIFDTENLSIEFIETKKRTILIAGSFKSSVNDEESFKKKFHDFAKALEIRQGEDIVLLDIESGRNFFIDSDWCVDHLESLGALKAKVSIKYFDIGATESEISFSSVEKTEKEQIEKWDIFSAFTDDCLNVLQQIKQYQQENNYEDFRVVFDRFLSSLAGSEEDEDKQS